MGESKTKEETTKKETHKKFRNFCMSLQNDKNDIDMVISRLKDMKSKGILKGYEYICHDKDVNEDGTPKLPHTHFLWCYLSPRTISVATRAVGLPKEMQNFVQVVHNLSASEEYLTHKNHLDKYQYSISEVHGNILERDKAYESEQDAVEAVAAQVADEGLTLREAEKILGGRLMSKHLKRFRTARSLYLDKQDLPSLRINFYICGEGGAGKDALASLLARAFYPDLEERDIIHKVTDLKAGFNKYDGQKCILLTDVRASDLIQAYGRSVTFDILDSRPKRTNVDVKYDVYTLQNEITFITGPDSYQKFLDGLSGEYIDKKGVKHESENKAQAYRRFPIVLELTEENIHIYLNMGWWRADRSRYEEYKKRGSLYIPGGIMALMMADSEERKAEAEESITNAVGFIYDDVREKGRLRKEPLADDYATFTEYKDEDFE